jgi:hypothetical protein
MNKDSQEPEKRIHPNVVRVIIRILIILLAPVLAVIIYWGVQIFSRIQTFIVNNSGWLLFCCGGVILIIILIFAPLAKKSSLDTVKQKNALIEFSDRLRDNPNETKKTYLELMNVVNENKATHTIDVHQSWLILLYQNRSEAKLF